MKVANVTRATMVIGALVLAAGLGACQSGAEAGAHDESMCELPKAGTITSVNTKCVMKLRDPVNPEVAPVEWKGQKVGFCCTGCKPRWAKLSDAEKDAAVAAAISASQK